MSAGMYGADIEALRRLAQTIDDGGSTLDAVVLTVEHHMPSSAQWEGPDGAGFRAEWSDTHAVALRSVADVLRDVAVTLQDNADAQESTSNDLAGPGGGGSGGDGTAGGGGGGGGGGGTGNEHTVKPDPNPLNSPGADPTKPPSPTDPNDPDYDPTSWNDRRGPEQFRQEYHGTNEYGDDQGWTSTENGQDAARSSTKGDISHTFAEGEVGDFAGYQEGVEGAVGSEDGAHASGEAGVAAGAGYDASGSVSLSENGLVAEGSAGASVGASASASGQVGYGEHLGAQGSAEAFVGARAEATAGASVGPHGLGVSAGVDAFAGAEAGVDGSVTAAGVTAGGSANVYAGIGINAAADVNFGVDNVSLDLEFGAALGIGAGFDVSLDWSPADTVDAIGDLGGDFVDGITGGWW